MMTGPAVIEAKLLEKKRIRQTSQYSSDRQWLKLTKAASTKEDKNAPANAPHTKKTRIFLRLSKRSGAATKRRVKVAPMTASKELLINQHKTRFSGTPFCNSTAR